MTDNQSKSIEKQPDSQQSGDHPSKQTKNIGLKSQKAAATDTITSSTSAQSNTNVNTVIAPQTKKVDIAIAGISYAVFCPIHEQEELHAAVSYINNYALDLKKEAPSLSQENLLVLCCLNLYEKIHSTQRNDEDRLQQDKQSEALLDKIIKDAQSVL